ncbi:hypothetical protein [Streptomyces sp. E2N171]|uniref:hypothetical protein n=1 Tax=Streptomyces TaxID=1883 RepID=UPI000EF561DA|nr:hypothetical protein [Streptomyces sp. E2N171]MQL65366.1 hypothetical protein [Streptomyces vinaceus]
MVTGSRARQVSEQEARDFGISADRVCLEIEQIFHDADDDVLRHTVTVDSAASRTSPGTCPL